MRETHAGELIEAPTGFGLHELVGGRRHDLVGIRNGIDTSRWNPISDRTSPPPTPR